jgi:hypothetical protein
MGMTTMSASPKLEEQRDAKLTLVVRRSTRQILKALKDHIGSKPKGQIIDELHECARWPLHATNARAAD